MCPRERRPSFESGKACRTCPCPTRRRTLPGDRRRSQERARGGPAARWESVRDLACRLERLDPAHPARLRSRGNLCAAPSPKDPHKDLGERASIAPRTGERAIGACSPRRPTGSPSTGSLSAASPRSQIRALHPGARPGTGCRVAPRPSTVRARSARGVMRPEREPGHESGQEIDWLRCTLARSS